MTDAEMDELFQIIRVNPKPMSIDDLIEASKRLSVSSSAVEEFKKRYEERSREEEESFSKITEEMLNRKYGE